MKNQFLMEILLFAGGKKKLQLNERRSTGRKSYCSRRDLRIARVAGRGIARLLLLLYTTARIIRSLNQTQCLVPSQYKNIMRLMKY